MTTTNHIEKTGRLTYMNARHIYITTTTVDVAGTNLQNTKRRMIYQENSVGYSMYAQYYA